MCQTSDLQSNSWGILGLYWDSGKENGNYYIIWVHIRVLWELYWAYSDITPIEMENQIDKTMENKMETCITG